MTQTKADPDLPPKRRQRRKDARPDEIISAAMEVFTESGYGAAKLEEIARRAGVAKGTLFVYFPNKDALFRAVARTALASNLERLLATAGIPDQPLDILVPSLLAGAASVGDTRISGILKLLVAESRFFPDLPRAWHDEVVSKMLGLLTAAIARAQARGEVLDGDPRLYAFSILGPMMAGVLFRDIFSAVDVELPDLRELAAQHARVVLRGMLKVKPGAPA